MVHATADGVGEGDRLRYGMVGGGRDAFIGARAKLIMDIGGVKKSPSARPAARVAVSALEATARTPRAAAV